MLLFVLPGALEEETQPLAALENRDLDLYRLLRGQRLSLQRHHRRSEHWYVVKGGGVVTRNEEELRVGRGHAVDIPRGTWHRILNPGDEDLVFICDVLHHVEGREAWLARLFLETKAGARLVLVEFKEGDLPQGPPEAMKIPKESMIKLVSNAGFVLAGDRSELLPYQSFLVFSKP